MSDIITEGKVSNHILSYTDDEYLYTGTVCRSWYKNSRGRGTQLEKTVESASRVEEALTNGFCSSSALKYSIDNGHDISVIWKLRELGTKWDEGDMGSAAYNGRLDVVEYMHKDGVPFDEEILRDAAWGDHIDVVKYLLDNKCPIDKTVLEKYDNNCHEWFKNRSMELAINNKNLGILKLLVGAGCPFIEDTFRIACNTKNLEIVQYLCDQGCDESDNVLYHDYIINRDYPALRFIFDNGLMKSEWGMCVGLCDNDRNMISFLINHGIRPKNEDIDEAIEAANLGLAKFFNRAFGIVPTSNAYMEIFSIDYGLFGVEVYIEILNWLFYVMEVEIGVSSFQDLLSHSRVKSSIGKLSDTIFNWYKERLD